MPDLRPGNRGIGVSVAVGHALPYGENLARIVIRRLVARDESGRGDVVIEPGSSVQTCRIYRAETPETDLYLIEFESQGRQMRCPLVQFQARTETASCGGAVRTRTG